MKRMCQAGVEPLDYTIGLKRCTDGLNLDMRLAYVDDFSEEESDDNEISITSNRFNDNSHVPLM